VSSLESREVIEQSLEQHKQELRVAVADLSTAARPLSRPRDRVRAQPVLWVIGACLLGVWLGCGTRAGNR
jgi:hypothetical protein